MSASPHMQCNFSFCIVQHNNFSRFLVFAIDHNSQDHRQGWVWIAAKIATIFCSQNRKILQNSRRHLLTVILDIYVMLALQRSLNLLIEATISSLWRQYKLWYCGGAVRSVLGIRDILVLDPDPRIRTSDSWIRIRLFSSATLRLQKTFFHIFYSQGKFIFSHKSLIFC